MRSPLMQHTSECFAGHMGLWLCEPGYVRAAHAAILAGAWHSPAARSQRSPMAAGGQPVYLPGDDPQECPPAYIVTPDGVAVVEMTGAMAKSSGKYAQVGTVRVRQSLRLAVADPQVQAILLCLDSPGGTVAGTQQLADEVSAAAAAKPCYAHAEDMCASAAYWTASQATRLTCNQSALVGSLGTCAVVYDTSEQAKMEGVKVHVLATGPYKGAFAEGAPITPEQLKDAQGTVDGINALFVRGVANGRRMSVDQAAKLFDGRCHLASQAKALGLVDAVQPFERTLAELVASMPSRQPENQRRLQLAAKRTP